MKNSGLLIALGLIGYGLYKFTQSGSSTKGLGSPFTSSGTAKVPSIFGARAPATAPVFGGYSTAPTSRAPAGGGSQFDLGAVASLATSAYQQLKKFLQGRTTAPADGEFIGLGDEVDPRVPSSGSPVPEFNTSSGTFDIPGNQGVDDFDTSDVGDIA